MAVRLLTEADLQKIPRANIVDFILNGIENLEQEIKLNELKANADLAGDTSERKVHINNLIELLTILVEECRHDPFTGKILIQAENLLPVLQELKETISTGKHTFWTLGKAKKHPVKINRRLDDIILFLEAWKKLMTSKFRLPLGNGHTYDTYHPQFPKTYPFKPYFLPDDYRSNFFFEVHVRELCPFTTTILFHSYSEVQRSFQEERSFRELSAANVNVEFRNEAEVEAVDNIRGFRIHGPRDDKKLPGSYIVIRGGHHRTRAIFRKYIKEEVDGDRKILIQLVDEKNFPDRNLMAWVLPEIAKREKIRERL